MNDWIGWAASLRLPAKEKIIVLMVAIERGNHWIGRFDDLMRLCGLPNSFDKVVGKLARLQAQGYLDFDYDGEIIEITLKEGTVNG